METLKRKRARSCPRMYNNIKSTAKKTCLEVAKKKICSSMCFQNLQNYFSEYCSASGIHGVRYLGERGRFLIEKLTWMVVITLVGYFCTILIFKAYTKWMSSPVIVTFANRETSIFKIPFPAVTICPEVKSDPEEFNFTDVFLKKLNNDDLIPKEKRYYQSLSLICTGLDDDFDDLEEFSNENLTISTDVFADMLKAFPGISSKTLVSWLGEELDWNSTLSLIFTSDGVCYSFNSLDPDDIQVNPVGYATKSSYKPKRPTVWNLEDGYPNGDPDTIPLRTFMSGISGGFEIDIFTNDTHLDYLCQDSLQGFKVTLHLPSELPNMDRHFRVPLDGAMLVAVKPRMITVSQELKPYKAKVRQCYFASERKLTFFRSYTQQNCLDECLSNYTLKECGCTPFYMPKYESSPICGPGSKDCLKVSKISYLLDQADFKINTTKNNHHSSCDCLPSCTSLEYDIEISQTNWNWEKAFQILDSAKGDMTAWDYKTGHLSKLAVYYREMQFLASERHEVYGFVDFFSNIGGLLGLFIGFSVTSAFEILYFLTLRILCNIKKFGRNFWAGQHNN